LPENMYEGMFLLHSSKYAADHEGVAQKIIDMIEKFGGSVSAHRVWQEGRLAYMIEGQRKGVHYLAYFRMEAESLKDLARACRLSDLVLRYMVIKQPETLYNVMVGTLQGASASATESETATKEETKTETKEETKTEAISS